MVAPFQSDGINTGDGNKSMELVVVSELDCLESVVEGRMKAVRDNSSRRPHGEVLGKTSTEQLEPPEKQD